MGKKSKSNRQKEKKSLREKTNDQFKNMTLDDIDYKPIKPGAFAGQCMHGDPASLPAATRWNLAQRKRWMEQATEIARFGQRYPYQSTLTSENQVSINWVWIKNSEGLVDNNWVKIAHASPVSELMALEEDMSADKEVQYDLARYKAELGITSKFFLQVGSQEFKTVFPSIVEMMESGGMHPTYVRSVKPQWALDMESQLESVRRQSGLVRYLQANTPCNCLDGLARAVQDEEPMNVNCTHGVDTLNAEHLTDEWKRNATNSLVRYAFSNNCANNIKGGENVNNMGAGTWRDWKPMREFFQENPSFACQEFAVFAYATATKFYLQKKDCDTSEQICNLALLAELCAKHGFENLIVAIEATEDSKNKTMEPYLRSFYIDTRKTTAVSGLLRLLKKKTPCNCIDDSRGILHAEGSERQELCNVCLVPFPKSKMLTCSRCGIEEYCSNKCCDKDYPNHKQMCKLLASVASAD